MPPSSDSENIENPQTLVDSTAQSRSLYQIRAEEDIILQKVLEESLRDEIVNQDSSTDRLREEDELQRVLALSLIDQ